MLHFRLVRSCAAAFLFACPLAASPPSAIDVTPETLSSALDGLVPRLLTEGDVPGLCAAAVRDGRPIWHRCYGVKDAATKAPLDDETVFEAASLSKPVFAYAVLKLVDAGVIALDVPVQKYLPGDYSSDPRFAAITPRHVLSHAAGLPNWRSGPELKTFFPPGERFSYSGEGFVYLQKAVERTTGQTLGALMKRLVFEPLDMSSSAYSWEDRFESRKATGHDAVGNPKPRRRPAEAGAASSLHTTALDYARFLAAALDGIGLSPKTFDEMVRPQVLVDEACSNCVAGKPSGHLSRELAWGLGWGLQETDDGRSLWHWGDNSSGFHCDVVGYPRRRLGLVVFTNGLAGHGIIPDVVEAAIGGKQPAFAWIGYERWNSPARALYKQVLAGGLPAVERYRRSNRSSRLGEEKINRVGYWLLASKKLPEAVAVFEMNAADFPKSANAFDSLGEAYAESGQRDRAIGSYEKSLELNPDNVSGAEALRKLKSERPRS